MFVFRNLNQFPIESSISKDISPLKLVTGQLKLDYNLLKLEYGEYVEIYKDNKSCTNSNNTRGIPAITSYTKYNATGSY